MADYLAELRATPPPHGTESRYVKGCRCEECRTASTTARRERRKRPNVKRHGWVGYSNGCRCSVCVAGRRAYYWLIGPARAAARHG